MQSIFVFVLGDVASLCELFVCLFALDVVQGCWGVLVLCVGTKGYGREAVSEP